MTAVWKFPLLITDRQEIKMPAFARPLSVGMQYGQPVLWAEVEPGTPPLPVVIHIAGTGHPLPKPSRSRDDLRFLGTLITEGGALVWHVFHEGRA